MWWFWPAVLSFAATAVLALLLRRWAGPLRLMDAPDARKLHRTPVARCGGLAMGLGMLVALATQPAALALHGYAYPLALVLFMLIGAAGDASQLSAFTRLTSQLLAVLAVGLLGGLMIENLGDLWGVGPVELGVFSVFFTVFATAGVINAVNMSDGMDGLAGGIVLIALAALLVLALAGEAPASYVVLLTTAVGAVSAFLLLNLRAPWRRQALIFMGDAGSMMLGALFAFLAADLSHLPSGAVVRPITAVWILGLPIMDTLNVMFARMSSGTSPLAAGRDHLHHVLLRAGLGYRSTVLLLLAASALFAGVGVGSQLAGVPEPWLMYGYLAVMAVYFVVSRIARGMQAAGATQGA